MPYYATDTERLSIETRGAVAYILAAGKTTFTPKDIQDAGVGKNASYRILGELKAAGYITKGGGHTYQWLKSYAVSGNREIAKSRNHAHVLDHDLDHDSGEVQTFSFSGNQDDFNHSSDDGPEAPEEFNQDTLFGLSGTPSPVPPVPSPTKPARKAAAPRKPKPTPEQAAIRKALMAAANWGPDPGSHAQAASNGDKLMEFDPAATPERIARFAARYFPRFSPVAVARAAKQDTPPTNPTPAQVVKFWPSFQAWEAAQAEHERREEQATEQPRPRITEEQRRENQRILQEAMRRASGYGDASRAPVAMVAAGRAT